ADEPRGPRVLQTADARDECDIWRRGDRALLLPRQLLRRQRVHSRTAHPRAHVEKGAEPAPVARAAAAPLFHLWRDQHEASEYGLGAQEARSDRRKIQRRSSVRTTGAGSAP